MRPYIKPYMRPYIRSFKRTTPKALHASTVIEPWFPHSITDRCHYRVSVAIVFKTLCPLVFVRWCSMRFFERNCSRKAFRSTSMDLSDFFLWAFCVDVEWHLLSKCVYGDSIECSLVNRLVERSMERLVGKLLKRPVETIRGTLRRD